MSTVVVTGGTGTLGRQVVRALLDGDHDVRVLSRGDATRSEPFSRVRVDYRHGPDLDAALGGADAAVHCATSYRGREADLAGAVTASARRTGCPHLLYISIVGADRVPLGYYRSKVAAERVIADSGVPWTVLRTTQFHELVLRGLTVLARPPVLLYPSGVRVQLVHAGEVAVRLAELAAGPPAGRAPDMGGPEVRTFADLARTYLTAAGRRRRLVPFRLPGATFRAYRDGLHLAPGNAAGRMTFAEFLAQR